MRIRPSGAPQYQLKVMLRGACIPIWRRFLVPADISLSRLHDALQAVMGWTDEHLHQFLAHGVRYGVSERRIRVECVSESETTLDQVLRQPKDRLTYEYDFGDGWMHDAVLEKILPSSDRGLAGRLIPMHSMFVGRKVSCTEPAPGMFRTHDWHAPAGTMSAAGDGP